MEETIQTDKSKLRWRCRRGVKELDIILEKYLLKCYDSAKKQEQLEFKKLLKLEDPLLLAMLMGSLTPDRTQQFTLIEKLRKQFVK